MNYPTLRPAVAAAEDFAGFRYKIEGPLVPVLAIELADTPVYFEHHVLLWKDPEVQVAIKPLKGAFKRILAGMPIFMTETKGRGRIAFSRDGVGELFAIHLQPGQSIDCREHQFLAASSGVDFTYQRIRGAANLFLGGSGFFMDTFHAGAAPGIVWLHGYGNVFEVKLAAGESIDVEPGGWVYKDPTVKMETMSQGLKVGLFGGGGGLFWNRFSGPGRLGLQSMYVHMPTAE
ncbi:MAG TPA: AIM24 family protein [Kofleriaceae bacterium]|nr:AIM24 family protein [Kofleriaceae bacterium]